MPALSTIALRDVSFSYGSHAEPLFSGLTTHFPPGFTGIVGANGAGKTTLLRVIAGPLRWCPRGHRSCGVLRPAYRFPTSGLPVVHR